MLGSWLAGAVQAEKEFSMMQEKPEDLAAILRSARERNRPYLPPPPDELRQGYTAVQMLLRHPRSAHMHLADQHFAGAHFALLPTWLGGAPAVAVREDLAYRRGGGIYIFRLGMVPRERLIQVPHSFFDMGTLPIGLELADLAQARALFVNTIHRYQGGKAPHIDEDESSSAVADLAHQEFTFFQSFTMAALSTLPRVQVIQIHGFADGAVADCPQAQVVISAGAAAAGAQEAAQVTGRLGMLLGPSRVLLFPKDTRRYGARKNLQGRAVAANGGASFLHIEISHSLRMQLHSDSTLRRAFAAAVIGTDAGLQGKVP